MILSCLSTYLVEGCAASDVAGSDGGTRAQVAVGDFVEEDAAEINLSAQPVSPPIYETARGATDIGSRGGSVRNDTAAACAQAVRATETRWPLEFDRTACRHTHTFWSQSFRSQRH